MRTRPRGVAARIMLVTVVGLLALGPSPARAAGDWTWPIVGPIVRGFEPPAFPYGPGHRGIDIGAPAGTVVVAPAPGIVTFAGTVAGSLYLTIDHGGGVVSTYSWLMGLIAHKGDVVTRGQPIARSGFGDPGSSVSSLHLGVKVNGVYVDPLEFLMPLDVSTMIRLAPLPGAP
jgi:murein DD-endopeptidase MepM/ murein hydrolase activator NlpD